MKISKIDQYIQKCYFKYNQRKSKTWIFMKKKLRSYGIIKLLLKIENYMQIKTFLLLIKNYILIQW